MIQEGGISMIVRLMNLEIVVSLIEGFLACFMVFFFFLHMIDSFLQMLPVQEIVFYVPKKGKR